MSERRTADELLARYTLEPGLRDVYVEGPSDRRFFEWALKQFGIFDVMAYEIDSVSVPSEMLKELPVEDNHRGRVIALAHYLQARSRENLFRRVACIADKDFDHLLGIGFACQLLIFTDYCAVELFCLDEIVLEKFLTLIVGRFPLQARQVIEAIIPVLRELFLIRLTNRVLSLGLQELAFEKCCSLRGTIIVFDRDEYVSRYLNKSGKAAKRGEFVERLEELRASAVGDPRLFAHGHDFVSLLNWFVGRIKRRNYDVTMAARSLVACVERSRLEGSQLFGELARRFS